MITLKFAVTHNMVAFLSKPSMSDGFEQIVDFLNAHPVKYALTINPTIYTSCIEQLWSTVKAKTINGESQLHALVDGKKIIITESSVRRDFQLEDENGIDCLPNSTIFEQLALMGVLDLEKTKTTQHNEIASLKKRVKKLEKKNRSRTHKLKRLYKVGLTAKVESSDNEESLGKDASKQGRIDAIDADEEITLVSVHDEMEVDEEVVEVINTAKLIIDSAQVSVAVDKVSTASVATTVSAATTTTVTITTVDDITLAQALEEMKSTKPKKKGVVIQELGESATTKSSQLSSQDKGKGILVEPVKPMKKKDQISFDEETALKLQVEFDDEERLAREKAEKEEEPILP
ncbi:hypothetical protein Tco_1048285 [Tanacetum coccineum]